MSVKKYTFPKRLIVVLLILCTVLFIAADRFVPSGNSLADAIQWLAVQTACTDIYSFSSKKMNKPDPTDHYRHSYLSEYLGRNRRSINTGPNYGVCWDYAKNTYEHMTRNAQYYRNLGMKEWYLAVSPKGNSRQIVLYDLVPYGQHDRLMWDEDPVKEIFRRNVQTHGNNDNHAWLWVIARDDTIYWFDPTWTDNSGYVTWGIVQNDREGYVPSLDRLCVRPPPGGLAFISFINGDADRFEGRWDQAIVNYNETIREEPNYAPAWNNRGRASYNKGDYDKAIADCTEAIRLDPKYADAYTNRGLAYLAKNDLDKAFADFSQAITLDAEISRAYHGRARVYLAKTDYNNAYRDARKAVSLFPREAVYIVTQGEILIAMKEFKLAVTMLETALLGNPNVPNGKELLERAKRGR
jgi:tetratricopeptide (TPR) repeat protein